MSHHTDSKQNKRNGILICGSYGLGNAGDESILKAILLEVRSVAPHEEITVMSRNPAETAARHGVESIHMFDFPAVRKTMKKARVYLNGGGNLIQDVTSRRSLWYYLYTLRTAKRCGCKVLMYGCGIGPVHHAQDIALTRKTLNGYVDMITLRENSSLKDLQRFGVTKPEVILSADPVISLKEAPPAEVDQAMEALGLDPHGKYLCLCLRQWPGFEEKVSVFAETVRYAEKAYGLTPVFLSINHLSDGKAADAVLSVLGEDACVIRDPLSTELTLGMMARMQSVISMRLHGLIFAAGQGVPLVGVVYDPKVSAFLSFIGQPLYEDLIEITTESLCKNLDSALSLRSDTAALESAVAHIRELGQNNPAALSKLLSD